MDPSFDARNSQAPSNDGTALKKLQGMPSAMTGQLRTPDMETQLLDTLQRKPVTSIDRYQVYTDISKEDTTTVFVHNPSGKEQHKYIIARTSAHTFFVACPLSWTLLHKHVVARVMAVTDATVYCPGGGFVSIGDKGDLRVEGESTDYGPGDHRRAKAALAAAVRNSVGG